MERRVRETFVGEDISEVPVFLFDSLSRVSTASDTEDIRHSWNNESVVLHSGTPTPRRLGCLTNPVPVFLIHPNTTENETRSRSRENEFPTGGWKSLEE